MHSVPVAHGAAGYTPPCLGFDDVAFCRTPGALGNHDTARDEQLRKRLLSELLFSLVELQSSLYGVLPERIGIRVLIQSCKDFIVRLEICSKSRLQKDGTAALVQEYLKTDEEALHKILLQVWSIMQNACDISQLMINDVLTKIFSHRIRMRFLLRQYLLLTQGTSPGFSGLIDLRCSPERIASEAASEIGELCLVELGHAPTIFVIDEMPETFVYPSLYLKYILKEVFKNACRAVVERCKSDRTAPLPPICCSISYSDEHVFLDVTDKGGGIPCHHMEKIWNFLYTTVERSPWKSFAREADNAPWVSAPRGGIPSPSVEWWTKTSALAGYGVGLKMSRLYARHFGGDLTVSSIDGVGTTVHVRLSRSARPSELFE